jgi:hypothetical protein
VIYPLPEIMLLSRLAQPAPRMSREAPRPVGVVRARHPLAGQKKSA